MGADAITRRLKIFGFRDCEMTEEDLRSRVKFSAYL